MRASTPQKALLRYLFHRESKSADASADVAEVLLELADLDRQLNGIYGLNSLGGIHSSRLQMTLAIMEENGFITHDRSNPHVELTELGRTFAGCVEFPIEIEKVLPGFLDGLNLEKS